jgi:hypothetical protein
MQRELSDDEWCNSALLVEGIWSRLVVIFTAYFDEADTHGPAPTVVLAAHVGHAYQWRRFETKLGRLQRQYGFKIFHAKDFKARAGEFSGWHPDKCQRLLNDLTFLIRSTLTEGIAFSLERDVYLKEYRASPIPKKMNLDSQLGVCFRACLRRLLDIMEQRQYRDRLNIVMEHGHPNVGNCSDIFFDLQKRLQRIGHNFLGTFTIERKEIPACVRSTHAYVVMNFPSNSAGEENE